MRTQFITPKEYEEAVYAIIDSTVAVGEKRPERFLKVMKENRGGLQAIFNPFGPTPDGLERKNPVIVALGDSVTAGHFEFLPDAKEKFERMLQGDFDENDYAEITDVRECYLEKFRSHLIDHFEQTSVSTINAGIAGDTMFVMQKRLYRDVIRYQADLVIINGSLNWSAELGDVNVYENLLTEVVESVKAETKSDIVLLTPNMDQPDVLRPDMTPSRLEERVEAIRRVAEKCDVCLADAYLIWKKFEAAGYPVKSLLANGHNHPSIVGHEIYARVLMQLIK